MLLFVPVAWEAPGISNWSEPKGQVRKDAEGTGVKPNHVYIVTPKSALSLSS
jgi:hypothetical protein